MIVIIGAGGHALEVLDVILESPDSKEICFFDNITTQTEFVNKYKILKSTDELKLLFPSDFNYILATGNPSVRNELHRMFTSLGGIHQTVISNKSFISTYATVEKSDVMKNCFISSKVNIDYGCLINTGAHIHHEVSIAAFTEISPGAIILGNVKIGKYCSIGANSTILPNVKIGDNVIVAAGAVVKEDVNDNCMVAGVPAKIKKELLPINFHL